MPTVNFSVPENVKADFNEAFAGENKSAIVARLMRGAVEEKRREERRRKAVEALLGLRRRARPANVRAVRRARRVGRS